MATKNEILKQLTHEVLGISDQNSNNSVKSYLSDNLTLIGKEDEDRSCIEKVKNILNGKASLSRNPYLVELLINEISDLLQLIISKRAELKNLEVQFLADLANTKLKEIKRVKDDAIWKIQEEFSDSGKILSKNTKITIKGNDVLADNVSAESIQRYESDIRKQENEAQRFVYELEDKIKDFAKDNNSGLNFGYRYLELKKEFESDLIDLYEKAKCLEIGLGTVYKIMTPISIENGASLVDNLYLWFKARMKEYNTLIEQEQEFTFNIPLIGGFKDLDSSVLYHEMPDRDANAFKGSGILQFKLSPDILPHNKLVRLRGISVGFTLLSIDIPNKIPEIWIVNVRPPKQKDITGTERELPLFNFTISRSSIPDFQDVKSLTFINADPFAPEIWTIYIPRVDKKLMPDFSEIVLHLRLAAI